MPPRTSVRTSATDPIQVAWLLEDLPGKIGLTFAPGKHATSKSGTRWARDLDADLDALIHVHGMTQHVCLLEDHELTRLRIPNLLDESAARGARVLRLPILDGGVLPNVEDVLPLIDEVVSAARRGEHVVIHCMGGLGRAGTIGGCALVAAGMRAPEALARLKERRGPRCPETDGQRRFIEGFDVLCHGVRAPTGAAPKLPGILRRTYALKSWRTWDHELHSFVTDFRARFGAAPHILLASSVTLTRIDMAARKQHIRGDSGERPDDAEYVSLAGFEGPDYSLDFCVEERLPAKDVSLIYDPDPDGGLPVPLEDTEVRAGPSVSTGASRPARKSSAR